MRVSTSRLSMGSGYGAILKGHYCRMAVGGLALLLSACGGGPPAKLYLLEPQTSIDPVAESIVRNSALEALGIAKVMLPGYAREPRIASLLSDGTVVQSDGHRWAQEPEDAISGLLAARLRFHAKSTVLIEPWPRDYKPDARIEVSFDKLLREPLGGAEMSGQIQIISGDGRRLIKAVPFRFVRYGRDIDNRVFFKAVAQGVDDIARLAIEQLTRTAS